MRGKALAVDAGPPVPSSATRAERPPRKSGIHLLLQSLAARPEKATPLIAARLKELEGALRTRRPGLRRLADETLDIHVPIANRLGLGDLRRRLEDVCFRILEPAAYAALKAQVAPIQAADDKCLEILIAGVRRLLHKNGIRAELHGRTKSLYGIYRKMRRTRRRLDRIMDRIGLRIIVASVPQCYAVLGLLHTHFRPIPGTFDDYIGLPKDNGYQSLHTGVYPVREISHKPIEFQIRTRLMHAEAEHGAAAHWIYKSRRRPAKNELREKWIQGLPNQHRRSSSDEAFIAALHRQVYSDQVVVFGNRGRIMRLPEASTVRDYLGIFNLQPGPEAAVRVNGRAADLDRRLQDGDSVEIVEAARPRPGATRRRTEDREGRWRTPPSRPR